jgi:hypothetical protein
MGILASISLHASTLVEFNELDIHLALVWSHVNTADDYAE